MEKFKLTLEMLEKFLSQKGFKRLNKRTGKEYYQFACPECKKIGKDSDDNHLTFYPSKNFPICHYDNLHGQKIYNDLKAFYQN